MVRRYAPRLAHRAHVTTLEIGAADAVFGIARGTSRRLYLVQHTGDLRSVAEGDLLCLELTAAKGSATITLALGPATRRTESEAGLATVAAMTQPA